MGANELSGGADASADGTSAAVPLYEPSFRESPLLVTKGAFVYTPACESSGSDGAERATLTLSGKLVTEGALAVALEYAYSDNVDFPPYTKPDTLIIPSSKAATAYHTLDAASLMASTESVVVAAGVALR